MKGAVVDERSLDRSGEPADHLALVERGYAIHGNVRVKSQMPSDRNR